MTTPGNPNTPANTGHTASTGEHPAPGPGAGGRGNPPTHIAYQVRDGKGNKSYWTRIGSAWTNSDGQGFNIQLDCVPLDGRITLRVASDKKD